MVNSSDLIVNPRNRSALDQLSNTLPQAVLLHGTAGVGLATVARHLAGKRLEAFIEPLSNKGDIDHSSGTITIETVRDLYTSTRSVHTGRVIIIDDAERMSHGAQNALLKLLEEPNLSTHFILTSHCPHQLLSTIRSRVQPLRIDMITPTQTAALLDTLQPTDLTRRKQYEFLASGLPAELYRLNTDAAYFEHRVSFLTAARDFLTGSPYQKILVIQTYYSDRGAVIQLLEACMQLLTHSIRTQPEPRHITSLDLINNIAELIGANHNTRLQLMRFVVQ